MAGKWVKAGVPVLIVLGAVIIASALVAGKNHQSKKRNT